jgi:replicative DNA helicase
MAHDPELLLIGGCLADESNIGDVTVTGDDFENTVYANIFDRILDRWRKRLGVTQPLLAEDFPQHMDVIWGSTNDYAAVSRVVANNRAVRERATRRKLREASARIIEWSQSVPVEDLVETARREIDEAVALRDTRVTSMLDDAVDVLERHHEAAVLMPSPWRSLNDAIGGFAAGRLYIIGARPSVGKSAIAAQIGYELAQHGAVVFATMEMDRGEVYSRIVSQQAGLAYGEREWWSAQEHATEREWLAQHRRDIRVLDSGTQTVASIRAASRSVARETPVAAVIIDYLHLLSSARAENETTRIADITRSLKQFAMDSQVPVIALSQLNRQGAARPGLADLRGSGAIEQDGDVAIFLYREEDENGEQLHDELHMFVAKNRQGVSHVDFRLAWEGKYVRAVD